MASDVCRKIWGQQKYAKSVEEEMLRSILKLVLRQERKFVNLVIEGCNSKRACCFTDAFVELEAYQRNRCEEPMPDRHGVFMTDIIDNIILEEFLSSGIEGVNLHHVEPFLAMLDFIQDRRRHEKAIFKILENTGKTPVTVALTEHLFSQLLASKDYRVDGCSKQLPKKCPCGCNADIKSGTTALGSCFTWHGRADVLLNQRVAVQILKEEDALAVDTLVNTQDTDNSETEDSLPVVKKTRVNSKRLASSEFSSEIDVAVKCKNGKDMLYDLLVLDQIVAEAVTNGFTQVNKHSSLSDLLIPTLGTTSEYFTIFLYDPVNDILLQDTLRFGIWEYPEDAKLNMFSVVCLWLFLNFTSFVQKTSDWRKEIEVMESKFHEIMDKKLERYKEIPTESIPLHQTGIFKNEESSYGEILDLTCQRIKKNI